MGNAFYPLTSLFFLTDLFPLKMYRYMFRFSSRKNSTSSKNMARDIPR